MTKNELAEEWVKENSYPYNDCPNVQGKLKQAYLAGFDKALNIEDASDKRLEPILYKLKDLGVISSWYKNGTYHAC